MPPPPKTDFGANTNMYANSYADTSNMFSGMVHVLFTWKASVYKLIWQDTLFFALIYALLSILYRAVLFNHPVTREWFEIICIYAQRFSGLIPISFLTGFYVTQVVTRWWDQFMSLPWPEKIAFKLVGFIPGKDNFRKQLRRTVMRYVNLSTVLVYRLISDKVQERFPTYDSLIEARLMLPHEVDRLRRSDLLVPFESSCTPILWAVKLLERARTDGKVVMEAPVYAAMISSLDDIQEKNRKLLNYGWMNFPLAYTQVATLSVLIYFVAAMFGRQYLTPRTEGIDTQMFPHINVTYATTAPFVAHTPDFYIPWFTFVEILCYMGWIKVADALLNAFGDDDQDFKVNYLIDRNLAVSYLIVDEAEEEMEMEDPFTEAGISEFEGKGLMMMPMKRSSALFSEGDVVDNDTSFLGKLTDSLRCRSSVSDVSSLNVPIPTNDSNRRAWERKMKEGSEGPSGGGGNTNGVAVAVAIDSDDDEQPAAKMSEVVMEAMVRKASKRKY